MERAVARKQKAQSRQRLDAQRWGLTKRMVRVAVAVYCLSQYSQDCVVEFALQARKRRKTRLPELDDDCPVQAWFLAACLEDIVGILVPETPDHQSIRNEAVMFLAERRTAQWVAAQNFRAGRAPTGCSLVDHYVAELRRFDVEARLGVDPPCGSKGARLGRMARRWCQRMRRKWGLRRGHLQEGELLTRDEVVHKAGPWRENSVFFVRNLKPDLSSDFEAVLLNLDRQEPKMASFFDAVFGFEKEIFRL